MGLCLGRHGGQGAVWGKHGVLYSCQVSHWKPWSGLACDGDCRAVVVQWGLGGQYEPAAWLLSLAWVAT